MERIKVLLCDDHQIFIDGLASILEKEPTIEIVARVPDGARVIDLVRQKTVDVVLLDISMPKMDGLEVTRRLGRAAPHVKVIALTQYDNAGKIRQMIEAGAQGYLIKNTNVEELVEAVQTVHRGEPFFKGVVLNKIIEFSSEKNSEAPLELLTSRELEILQLVARGYSNQDIASELYISIHTVHSHRKNMLRKLNLKNTAELISIAHRNNWIN